MSIRNPRVRSMRAAPAGLVGLTAVALVLAALAIGRGLPGAESQPSTAPAGSAAVPSTPPTASGRPGGLDGRAWIAILGDGPWIVGIIGGGQQVLPPDELPLDARDGRIVSVLQTPGGSAMLVRTIGEPKPLARIPQEGRVATAVIAGNTLYFAMYPEKGDPGVFAVDVPVGDVRTVIEPSPSLPPDWGNVAVRNQLRLSASGQTLASPVCGPGGEQPQHCAVDVIDLGTGAITRAVSDISTYLVLATDDVLVTETDARSELEAYDRQTGALLWKAAAGEYLALYEATADNLVVAWIDHSTIEPPHPFVLANVNARSGAASTVLTEPGGGVVPQLWPELSTDRVAVLGLEGQPLPFSFPEGTTVAHGETVDLATGEVNRDALTLTAP